MTITWNDFERTEEIEQAILRATAHIDEIHVVVAQDLERVVRTEEGYESFSADRTSGQVGGKMLRTGSGVVILGAPALLEFGIDYLERVTCHESGHVLTFRRGESEFLDVFDGDFGDADLRGLAVHVLDEHRAEKLAVGLGYKAEIDPEDIGHLLHAANCEILIALGELDIDPISLAQKVLTPLERVSKQIAVYLASDPMLTFLEQLEGPVLDLWESYVGDRWKGLTKPLTTAPSSEFKDGRLHGRVEEIVVALRSLLMQFGFSFVDDEEGHGFIRVGEDALFNSRIQMSLEFAEAYSKEE